MTIKLPPSWQGETQARAWWRATYDDHLRAGFSEADSRLRCWELARATRDPHKLRVAGTRRNQ